MVVACMCATLLDVRYVTDDHVRQIPALADSEDIDQALSNASRVLKYIGRNEWISDDDLRAYGERNGIDPDAMNEALGVLQDTGQIRLLDDDTPPPPEPEDA